MTTFKVRFALFQQSHNVMYFFKSVDLIRLKCLFNLVCGRHEPLLTLKEAMHCRKKISANCSGLFAQVKDLTAIKDACPFLFMLGDERY